jgi:hypothetical protein
MCWPLMERVTPMKSNLVVRDDPLEAIYGFIHGGFEVVSGVGVCCRISDLPQAVMMAMRPSSTHQRKITICD